MSVYFIPGIGFTDSAGFIPGGGFVSVPASGAVTLTGDNCSQSNTCTTGAITQTHLLTGLDCSQSNASTTGAITQTHVLAGDNCSQVNTSSTGAISVGGTVTLTGDNCTQVNNSNTGAITQTHLLLAQDCNQINVSTTGAITQTHILLGANCTQQNSSTTGAITIPGAGLTLSPEDIAAIADAVWSHAQAVHCRELLTETWGRLGLDISAPLVTGTTQISFGTVLMAMTEASGSVTLARQ